MPSIIKTAVVAMALAVTFAAHQSHAYANITYRNCTDKALCLSGCEVVQVPADTCFGYHNNQRSEILSCDPTIRVCGDLSYYTDPRCFNLMFTDGFLCDQCNADSTGNVHDKAVCSRGVDGLEFLALNACGSSADCSSCNNYLNVTIDTCIPVDSGVAWQQAMKRKGAGSEILLERLRAGGVMYAKYTGAITCNAVKVQQWPGSSSCSSSQSKTGLVPENSCLEGASMHCDWF